MAIISNIRTIHRAAGAALLAIAFLARSGEVHADGLFKWTDRSGKVKYGSSPPPDATEVESLHAPEIKKVDIESAINSIKAETPESCAAHGGVDCGRGADADGSVVCLDGFRDVKVLYTQECKDVRLQTEFLLEIRDKKLPVPFSTYVRKKGKVADVKGFVIAVRNLSGVKAEGLTATMRAPRQDIVTLAGPATLDAYGAAEYTVRRADIPYRILPYDFPKTRIKVRCINCSAVTGASK